MESNSNMRYPLVEDDGNSLFDSPNQTGSPERRLLVAILERAILDYVGNDSTEIDEAEEWLFGEGDESDPDSFSFLWLCRELDLDHKFVADKVKMMPKRGKNRVAPWYFMRSQN